MNLPRIRFNREALLFALLILIIEGLIATVGAPHCAAQFWWRHPRYGVAAHAAGAALVAALEWLRHSGSGLLGRAALPR